MRQNGSMRTLSLIAFTGLVAGLLVALGTQQVLAQDTSTDTVKGSTTTTPSPPPDPPPQPPK
jgi:uncharacterized membrane protein